MLLLFFNQMLGFQNINFFEVDFISCFQLTNQGNIDRNNICNLSIAANSLVVSKHYDWLAVPWNLNAAVGDTGRDYISTGFMRNYRPRQSVAHAVVLRADFVF